MEAVVNVCIIVLTISLVSIIVMLVIALKDVHRMRIKSEKFLDKMDQVITPILSEITLITEDIRQITYTARCQIEKVDSTADVINKNVYSVVERWINTFNSLNDAIVEPLEEIAVLLKGFSRGFKYFFSEGRDIKKNK